MSNVPRRGSALALLAGAGCLLLAPGAHPESTSTIGAVPLSTGAHLDITVTVPRFLSFRVGTLGANIDVIAFDVPGASVGSATPVSGTGGDAGGGSGENVAVIGNGGQVTITEANNSGGLGLQHATLADTINYNQIATSSSDSTNLNAPALSNAGGNTSTPVLTGSRVTNRSAVWTYAYANATIPAAGTYGTSAKGGRVTYTASMP